MAFWMTYEDPDYYIHDPDSFPYDPEDRYSDGDWGSEFEHMDVPAEAEADYE